METLILVGYGKMARALAFGLRDRFKLKVCGRDKLKIRTFCDELSQGNSFNVEPYFLDDNTIDIQDCHVLLCIKPYAIREFSYKGKASAVYSILNAVNLDSLKTEIGSESYIRAMPNVAAQFGKSITSLCGDTKSKDKAFDIFSTIGRCVWIDEKKMSIATAVGGCSPAFLAIIAESFIDSAVAYGLSRDEAREITQGLFYGFSSLLDEIHPGLIKESVMSPGGSTSQGVLSLERDGIRGIISNAILNSKNFA